MFPANTVRQGLNLPGKTVDGANFQARTAEVQDASG